VIPRVVVVTRPTDLEMMLLRHGTLAQARFFLESRGQDVTRMQARQRVQDEAVHTVMASIPAEWRRARIVRGDLDRFLFERDDIIVAVGQDGLVANVAKYLQGQRIIGVNPSKEHFDGVLVRHAPSRVAALLLTDAACEERTMVEATTPDGQRLVALNEIFIGHKTHQSARYTIAFGDNAERHSSSGLIVCTGTGATGWAKSVSLQRALSQPLPVPQSRNLSFLVREAWPSVVTGTSLVDGCIHPDAKLTLTSEMNEGGVVFGDGMEQDSVEFPFGQVMTVRAASIALQLVQ
jgi:NAD kinase